MKVAFIFFSNTWNFPIVFGQNFSTIFRSARTRFFIISICTIFKIPRTLIKGNFFPNFYVSFCNKGNLIDKPCISITGVIKMLI